MSSDWSGHSSADTEKTNLKKVNTVNICPYREVKFRKEEKNAKSTVKPTILHKAGPYFRQERIDIEFFKNNKTINNFVRKK